MVKKFLISILAIGTLATLTSEVQAGSLIIDDFSVVQTGNSQQRLEDNRIATSVTDLMPLEDLHIGLDTSHVIGGTRQLQLKNSFNETTNDRSLFVVSTNSENLIWNNDPGLESIAWVHWDADGAGLNLDLTGKNAIVLDIVSIDQDALIEWTLEDATGSLATSSATGFTSNTIAQFPLIDFDLANGFNFKEVDKISFRIQENMDMDDDSIDARFDMASFSEIPEPSTLLGLLGVSVLARSLRRKDND